MDYQEALGWIMSFWEPGRARAEELFLRPLKVPRMRSLLQRLGSPQKSYPCVLVAGTKGKGSTVAFVAEGLRAAGYRVGRYTQPHLIDWRERTWVDGALITPEEVVELVERIRPEVEALEGTVGELGGITTYEVGTALTLSYFAERKVEIAVLEIGVGGRLDALNAVDPVLSVVTSISLDHVDVLGHSLEEIAAEKAGIFRWKVPAVTARQRPEVLEVLRHQAVESGALLHEVGRDWRWSSAPGDETFRVVGPEGVLEDLRIPLLGDHQRENATTAVAALQLLGGQGFRVEEEAIRRGLASVKWPGRIQVVRERPTVVVDAAHNADSAARLMDTVRSRFRFQRLVLVFGASGDKDIAGMASVLGPAAHLVVVTSSGHRRAADLDMLATEMRRFATVEVAAEPAVALHRALEMASEDDLVLVAGSVFLAGRAIELLEANG